MATETSRKVNLSKKQGLKYIQIIHTSQKCIDSRP